MRHQCVFSSASAIASISASSFKPRTSAFSPCSRGATGSSRAAKCAAAWRHFHQFAEAAFVVFQNHVALHEVLEFAQIAGPRITHRRFQQVFRRIGRTRLTEFLAVLLQEMAEQQRNFRGPFAQRRHIDRKHVQAGNTDPRGTARSSSLPARPRWSRPERARPLRPDARPPSREYWWSCSTCSSLACRCVLISAISSRKIVPLLASSNLPGLERTAPVKAPCSNPNSSDSSSSPGSAAQFTLINGWLRRLRTHVNHARDHFLAHSAFAANKHRHVHRRDLQNLLADAHHLRAGGQEAQVLGNLVAVFAQRLIFRDAAAVFCRHFSIAASSSAFSNGLVR